MEPPKHIQNLGFLLTNCRWLYFSFEPKIQLGDTVRALRDFRTNGMFVSKINQGTILQVKQIGKNGKLILGNRQDDRAKSGYLSQKDFGFLEVIN